MAKTMLQVVQDLQTTFSTAGWREHIEADIRGMRDGLVHDLIYNTENLNLQGCMARSLCIQMLDQLLDLPARTAARAREMREDPSLGSDVVHSDADSRDLADAGVVE